MRWTCGQKRFTIPEVAADWHELMIPQHTMQPSIARVSKQPPPQSAALDLHPIARKLLLISHLMKGRRLSQPEHIAG